MSETRVKRGHRSVKGGEKELLENSAEMTPALRLTEVVSSAAASNQAAFDGENRSDYWRD